MQSVAQIYITLQICNILQFLKYAIFWYCALLIIHWSKKLETSTNKTAGYGKSPVSVIKQTFC